MLRPPRAVVRRDGGLHALERTLHRRGFTRVAGADEAGRGACAGPLVVAAVVLPPGRRGEVPELADSKLLTAAARDRVYDEVVARAEAHAVVVIPPGEVDARGLHRSNLDGMRRALSRLTVVPDYVLTDGFGVDGLGVPGLAVCKGDQVAACIAAASVLAKVTRDRLMTDLHRRHPVYDFAQHKGYVTASHADALAAHGPCAEHRMSYVNVAAALARDTDAPAFDRAAFAARLRRARLEARPATSSDVDVGNNEVVEDDEDMDGRDGVRATDAAMVAAGPRTAACPGDAEPATNSPGRAWVSA
ncbi:MAG TPA: ribonuclease HII [Cryptosporangiaceae bacterium]|nr:ribonuclease HII [Cryptosporangiaceae bacterium]